MTTNDYEESSFQSQDKYTVQSPDLYTRLLSFKKIYIILITSYERYLQKQERDREAEEKKLRENEFRSTFNKFMAQKKADKDQKVNYRKF